MSRLSLRLALALVVLLSASPLYAQGYGVYEHSPCVMGRGGAGVAARCTDGSSVFFNPAGIAFTPGQEFSFGTTLIRAAGHFTNDLTGNRSVLNEKNQPVPSAYYVRRLTRGLAAGFGFFAPYGLTTEWPETAEGRFLAYKSRVEALYFQPTVAYNLNDRVAIGAGLDLTRVEVELRQRADLSRVALPGGGGTTFGHLGVPAGTDFADVSLAGHGWSAGFHVGVQARATDRVSFGARYLGGQTVRIENGSMNGRQIMTGQLLPITLGPTLPAGTPLDKMLEGQFRDGGPLSAQAASTELPMPAQFVMGTAIDITPRATLLFDYQFVNWSAFDTLVVEQEAGPDIVNVEDYNDTHGFRAGVEYKLTERTVLRGGFLAHNAAAPDQTVTPLLPEGARREYTVGLGAQLSRTLRFDVAYQYLDQVDRAGRTTDGGMSRPTPAVNNGVYSFNAHLLGIGLAVVF